MKESGLPIKDNSVNWLLFYVHLNINIVADLRTELNRGHASTVVWAVFVQSTVIRYRELMYRTILC